MYVVRRTTAVTKMSKASSCIELAADFFGKGRTSFFFSSLDEGANRYKDEICCAATEETDDDDDDYGDAVLTAITDQLWSVQDRSWSCRHKAAGSR